MNTVFEENNELSFVPAGLWWHEGHLLVTSFRLLPQMVLLKLKIWASYFLTLDSYTSNLSIDCCYEI